MTEIREYALGTLAEWLGGYTFPEDGPQRRIRVTDTDDESVTVSVDDSAWFRISLQVERVVSQ